MTDLIDSLPREEARQIRRMAQAAGSTPEAIMRAMLRAYLSLLRDAPAALPQDPLTRLAGRGR